MLEAIKRSDALLDAHLAHSCMMAGDCEREEAQHCMTFIQLNGEVLISLQVRPGDRVADLVKLVRDALGIGKRFCTLILDGYKLQPMATLTESDLQAGDITVTVVISTPAQLKDAGLTAWELRRCGYTVPELKDAGYDLTQIRIAHYSAQELMDAGFSIRQLRLAFASAQELKDAGCTVQQLKDAGYTAQQLWDARARAGGC
jgi:biotin operon repressor